MPFKFVEEEAPAPKFKFIEEEKPLPGIVRAGAKVPAEFFGSAIGTIPSIATAQAQLQPQIQQQEREATPDYLPSSGLEAAPEKGISNLLALIGQFPEIEKYTVPALRERFKETTGGKFEPQSHTEKVLARAGELAGSAIPLGGTGIGNLAVSGGLGQVAREFGLPEKIATTIELLSSAPKGTFKNQLIAKDSEKALVDFAKKRGLTETEIAPLLKGEATQDILSKLAIKGPRTKKIISGLEEKLGDAYGTLKNEVRDSPRVSGNISGTFGDKLGDILKDLRTTVNPSPDKKAAINFLEEAYENVMNRGVSPEELINFYQDINSVVNWKVIKGGKKQLAKIKEPIKETLREINPRLAEEFELTNELYSKFKGIEKELTPDLADKFKTLGTAGAVLTGVATFNLPTLSSGLGSLAGQILAREILVNPRLQALQKKAMSALSKNNIKLANIILKNISDEMKKTHPKEFKDVDFGSISEPSTDTQEE